MAIQSPQEWLASKSSGNTVKKTSRIQSPLEWLKSKPKSKVELEKEERLAQGLPISTTSKRAAPTGLGNIIRGVVKPVADVAANAINAGRIVAGKETKDTFKSSYLGDVKGLGQIDITKSPFEKENLKVMLKSAATGAEIASYLSAGGVAKGTITDLTKRGVLASKKTFAEWVVKKFPELAKEGFIQGTAYTTGSQGRDYVETGKPFSVGQAVKDIGLSTVGNVVVPAVIRKGFGASTAKIAGARAGEKAAQEAEILGKKIPNAVTPETRPVVKTTEAFDVADKLGYNFQTSTDILRDVVEKTGRSGTYNVDDIIEAAKKYPPEKTPTVEVPTQVTDTPTPKTEKPKAEPKFSQGSDNTYNFNEDQFKRADDFAKQTDPEFQYGGAKVHIPAFSKIPREDLVDIATGVKQAPVDIPATVVKALTKELPDLTKAERNRLAKSTFVQSKAGSELAGAKQLTDEVINDPYTYTAKKQKELTEKALKKGYTKKTINRFLDDLECPQ